MEFICKNCNKIYKSRVGLWKHHKTCVPKEEEKKYICSFCNKLFSCRQSRWVHQKTCQIKNTKLIAESVTELKNQIKILESKPNIQNNIINDNKIINNITQNIVITNAPGYETIDHLTIEQKQFIMNKGLSSLMYLIETTNFDKSKPENHSYCVTALNDKHASMVDTKTNSIIKTDKMELYDKVLAGNLNKLEKLSGDTAFGVKEKTQYIETVERLKNTLFLSKKGIKKYYSEINLLSYNNKELVQETWNGLQKLDEMVIKNPFIQHTQPIEQDKIEESSSDIESDDEVNTKKLNELRKIHLSKKPIRTRIINVSESDDSELSDSESEDDGDKLEISEITINGIKCIIENNMVYRKLVSGEKGQVYGTYNDGKIIKTNSKSKNIEL